MVPGPQPTLEVPRPTSAFDLPEHPPTRPESTPPKVFVPSAFKRRKLDCPPASADSELAPQPKHRPPMPASHVPSQTDEEDAGTGWAYHDEPAWHTASQTDEDAATGWSYDEE